MKLNSHVLLTMNFHKEGESWVGICKELGTSTYASSLEDVQKELGELVELHLNSLEELGERDKFFRENNITLTSDPKDLVWVPASLDPKVFTQPYLHNIKSSSIEYTRYLRQ